MNTDPDLMSIMLERLEAENAWLKAENARLRESLQGSPENVGRSAGRPQKHSIDDLADCLGHRIFSTAEFRKRAHDTLDISRATFYRLLERGRREWRFRQDADGQWRLISQSQKGRI